MTPSWIFVLVSGQVRGPNGEALAQEVVTQFNDKGQQFVTLSDEKGQFSFSAETIRPRVAYSMASGRAPRARRSENAVYVD